MNSLFPSFLFVMMIVSSYATETQMDNQTSSKLSLREKIGQLCCVAVAVDEDVDQELMQFWHKWQPQYQIDRQHVEKLIKDHHIGGIVLYGRNASPQAAINLTMALQSISPIPLLVTMDAELGLGMRLNEKLVVKYPYNTTLGAIQNLDLIYRLGFEIGCQLSTIGVHVNFAPVIDINNNPNNPVIEMRAFSSDKERVANCGIAYMQGLQDAGIIACAKHFPGHGDTAIDSHVALPLISHSQEHLYTNELYPFQKLIQAGVKSVMTAHLEIPALENEVGLPSSLSKAIVTDILQKEMRFEGLIFSDALGMKGVADRFAPGEIELRALLAGNDVLLCPLDTVKAIDRIEQAVINNEISIEAIDRKVSKILDAKKWSLAQPKSNRQLELDSLGAKELCRALYKNAITCLKSTPIFIQKLAISKTMVINTAPELNVFESTLEKNSAFAFKAHSFNTHVIDILEDTSNVIISVSKGSFDIDSDQCFLDDRGRNSLDDLIQECKAKGKEVTLVLFCSPYFLCSSDFADNVIQAYETAVDAQIATAELLSGYSQIIQGSNIHRSAE